MNITEQKYNRISVFQPHGRVDNQGAIDLEVALQAAYMAGNYWMILDLSHVTYINSSGLRVLATMLTETQTNGGDLLLACPSEKVHRIFHIIGFDKFFRLFDTLKSALQAF